MYTKLWKKVWSEIVQVPKVKLDFEDSSKEIHFELIYVRTVVEKQIIFHIWLVLRIQLWNTGMLFNQPTKRRFILSYWVWKEGKFTIELI